MLTTTYSMVVLSSEQQNTRRILGKLERSLHNAALLCAGGVDRVWLESVLHKLMKVDKVFHERKVERYVIPALRSVPEEVAGLLDRLDTFCSDAMRILLCACSQFEQAATGIVTDIGALVSTIELYCRQMFALLALEEDELFPVARRQLSNETWFQIATSCLSDSNAGRMPERSGTIGMSRRRSPLRHRHVH
jgi:hypothetical protein